MQSCSLWPMATEKMKCSYASAGLSTAVSSPIIGLVWPMQTFPKLSFRCAVSFHSACSHIHHGYEEDEMQPRQRKLLLCIGNFSMNKEVVLMVLFQKLSLWCFLSSIMAVRMQIGSQLHRHCVEP